MSITIFDTGNLTRKVDLVSFFKSETSEKNSNKFDWARRFFKFYSSIQALLRLKFYGFEIGFEIEFEIGFKIEFEIGFEIEFEIRFEIEFEIGFEIEFESNFKLGFESNFKLRFEIGSSLSDSHHSFDLATFFFHTLKEGSRQDLEGDFFDRSKIALKIP